MTSPGLLETIFAAEKLKKEKRKGWIAKAGIKNPESVADHSYATALIAMIVGDDMNLNTEKMIRMALLHDLGESIIGDIMPGEDPWKEEMENRAMGALFSKLSGELRSFYEGLWQEFRVGESPEAVIVHQIDKLEMGIQAMLYLLCGKNEVLQRFMNAAEDALDNTRLLSPWTASLQPKVPVLLPLRQRHSLVGP